MKTHTLSLVAGCLILLASAAISAQAKDATGDFQEVMKTATTCFTGTWASAETYVAARSKRNPAISTDEREQAKTKQDYLDIRETYECQWFDYRVDGFEVRGFYSKPKKPASSSFPVIIYNRGGNADIGALPVQYIMGKLFPVVKEGFVVVGSMYRGASLDGSPHPDRLADEFGGRDVNDVLALLPIIDDMPFVDSDRLGIWGTSRGGMMAYLAARQTDRFLALIAEAAPSDLEFELAFRSEMEEVLAEWIPDFVRNRGAALHERSAVSWAGELPQSTAILILHGTADRQVSPQSALSMASKLQELGRSYRLVIFAEGGHGLHRTHQDDVTREVVEFFESKLKDKPRF